ncbi:DUF3164 family protein [Natronospirillum operosum]|uniref:DUF3164 family protein n=1 Tax=Natronospirillum operosum TaxID=2759953 RepID=A0A4Z0W5Z8_9GAMM|nr:DUF3164 family protein [Natronospirillum operosum]TGG92510.1 DUF3164 family protein [Natronospirillum operosum]
MTEQHTHDQIPAGYLMNASGHLVPESQVREQDKLRDQIARDLVEEALKLNSRLGEFKRRALDEIADLVSISAERYDVKMGGRKGNVSIATYNGEYMVKRSYAELIGFTEELETAKELVNQCIMRWSEGANDNIRALVDRAFRTDARGQMKTTAILELLRLEIDDDEWQRAMEALKDSIQSQGTAVYVRIYRRDSKTNKYLPVPLDLAAV